MENSLPYILLALGLAIGLISIIFFIRKVTLFIAIRKAQKRYGETNIVFKTLAVKAVFPSITLVLITYFIFLIPSIVAVSAMSGLNSDCMENTFDGLTLNIVTITEETQLLKYNPYDGEQFPSDVHYYQFTTVANLQDNTLSSNEIIYSTPLSIFGNRITTCSSSFYSELEEGSTYLVFLRYRNSSDAITNTDPRKREGSNYTVGMIIKLDGYNRDVPYYEQSESILNIISQYDEYIID